MTTKLRQWLQDSLWGITSWEGISWRDTWRIAARHTHSSSSTRASTDWSDLAFSLATANDIDETLPEQLCNAHQWMQDTFPALAYDDLFVLFSGTDASDSFLYHARKNTPSPALIQALHRAFTINNTTSQTTHEVMTLIVEGKSFHFTSRQLLQAESRVVWLLFAVDAEPALETLKWHTASLEAALTKGISAWYQRQEEIDSALGAERSMYAAELHDSLAQVLGYLRIKSARLDKLCLKDHYRELRPMTEELAAYTQSANRQTRELITTSRLTLHTENLSEGVINSIREFEQQSAIVFELDNRLRANELNSKQSMQILYIIREGLSNIVRHSHASHSRVSLILCKHQRIKVIIEDNGIGIKTDTARCDSFGLQIMDERAKRISAELTIGKRAGGGTKIQLILPSDEENE